MLYEDPREIPGVLELIYRAGLDDESLTIPIETRYGAPAGEQTLTPEGYWEKLLEIKH